MGNTDLRAFIKQLEVCGELVTINTEVSPKLEIAEITDRVSKGKKEFNKALLFTKVQGFDFPVLINAFGSYKRICLALGVDNLDEIGVRIKQFIKPKVPESFLEKLAMLPTLMEIGKFPPKLGRIKAQCQEIVLEDSSKPILDRLPIITCWPYDAAPFITFGAVITRDPKSQIRNLGIYRMQYINNNTLAMHWHKHHDGAMAFENQRTSVNPVPYTVEPPNYGTFFDNAVYSKNNVKLEVAVVIGCDPAVTYAASAPLPPDIDEFLLAGFLRQSPVILVKCKTIDLEVPANAEIIIEGYVDQMDLINEGPFGDHTGFYSLPGLFPIFHVTAVTHRQNPIYQTTIVGKPPQEDCYLGKATERIFLPMVQLLVPEIIDMNLPWEGVFHNCAIISINKRYPGQAKKVMNAVWGLGQLMFTKFVIVVDKDVNVHDLSNVALVVFGNTDPRRDTIIVDGPVDILDHASPYLGFGSKMGIDATVKWQAEGCTRDWPKPIIMSEDIINLVTSKWKDYGL